MKDKGPTTIDSVAKFLAYAYLLTCESAERYQEMADSMEVHNNLEVAELFQQLADYGEQYAQEIIRRAEGIGLPDIPPWEVSWMCPQSQETTCSDCFHYQMSARQALEVALYNEIRGREFYAQVASESPDESVCHMAAEFATRVAEHIDTLNRWRAKAAEYGDEPLEDIDPPNVPE